MANRTPTKVTVQARHCAYLPPQVRVTRHYGRGFPIEYGTVIHRPRYPKNRDYVPSLDDWAEHVAANIRSVDNGWPDPVVLPSVDDFS